MKEIILKCLIFGTIYCIPSHLQLKIAHFSIFLLNFYKKYCDKGNYFNHKKRIITSEIYLYLLLIIANILNIFYNIKSCIILKVFK